MKKSMGRESWDQLKTARLPLLSQRYHEEKKKTKKTMLRLRRITKTNIYRLKIAITVRLKWSYIR